MTDTTTDIERERQRRLQANAMRMGEMGLANATCQLLREQSIAKAPRKELAQRTMQHQVKSNRASGSSPKTPEDQMRRSSRVKQLPAPTYAPVDFLHEEGDRKRRRSYLSSGTRGRRGEGSGSRVSGNQGVRNNDGWQHHMGVASSHAAYEARAAALQQMEEVESEGRVAALKDMSESQVSGGFWCQLPKKFVSAFGRIGDKFTVSLLNGDDEDDSTNVIFLPRPGGGAGLSGGWRTFAINHRIFPNDFVVFEKISEQCIKAHIFRAYDYDDDFEIGDVVRGSTHGHDGEVEERQVGLQGEGGLGSKTRAPVKRGKRGGQRRLELNSSASDTSEENIDEEDEEEDNGDEENSADDHDQEEEEEEEEEEGLQGVDGAGGDDEVYEVDRIVGYCPPPSESKTKRNKGPVFNQEMFKIRWKGYSTADDTWEPKTSLNFPPRHYKWEGGEIPLKYKS